MKKAGLVILSEAKTFSLTKDIILKK